MSLLERFTVSTFSESSLDLPSLQKDENILKEKSMEIFTEVKVSP
jgi:hypothetical protein